MFVTCVLFRKGKSTLAGQDRLNTTIHSTSMIKYLLKMPCYNTAETLMRTNERKVLYNAHVICQIYIHIISYCLIKLLTDYYQLGQVLDSLQGKQSHVHFHN